MRLKILQIPAADVGNIVGYEVEQELRPYVLQDEWLFPADDSHGGSTVHFATSAWMGIQSGVGESR